MYTCAKKLHLHSRSETSNAHTESQLYNNSPSDVLNLLSRNAKLQAGCVYEQNHVFVLMPTKRLTLRPA